VLTAQQANQGRASVLPSVLSTHWQTVLAEAEHVPVQYTPSFIRYQESYFGIEDESQIFFNDNRPVAVWPFAVKDGWATSNGSEVLPPLFVAGLPERVQKHIITDCLNHLNGTLDRTGHNQWWTNEVVRKDGISLWHRRVLEHGGEPYPAQVELFVDLGWSYERIRTNIRKSYRSLLHSGKKDFDTILGMNIEPLHKLHIEVAGRITRSDETWERQQEAVDAGEAFVVYLLDKAECIVGGALFHRSRDEAAYAVGVYRRDLHDAPLGHLAQAFAIEHMQVLGLRWYYLGLRAYEANEKELQIAHFKEGWATHSFPRVTACIHRK